MGKLVWHTEKRIIDDLIPYEKNPRKMSESEKKELGKSLEKFNLVEIPAIDTDNKIIAGHQRLKGLQLLGRGKEEIDVRVPNRKLTEEEFKEYNIRSNSEKNVGDWDWGIMMEEENILLDIGWTNKELNEKFTIETEIEEDGFDAAGEYEKIKEPITKIGDIYEFKRHRIVCGDATKIEDVNKLMKGNKARMIFTDPPYNVDYKSPGGLDYSSTKFGGTGGRIFNDKKSDKECIKFYTDILKNLYEVSTDDVTIYWWFANKNNWINRIAFEEAKWHMSQIVIWLKNSMVFSRGQDYRRQYEPCMVGWKKGKVHYKNKKISNLKDVFNLDFNDYVEMLDVWYEHRDITSKYIHPTQKPVRLPIRALKKNSEVDDIVIDVFGGSFSTMIACNNMKRIFYGMELDPKYVDVGVKRIIRNEPEIVIKRNNIEIDKNEFI